MTITVQEKVFVYKPIVAEAQIEADLYLWQLKKLTKPNSEVPAEQISLNNNKTLHIWAEPGKYELKLITITVDWENKKITYNENVAPFEVVIPTVPLEDQIKLLLSKLDPTTLSSKDKAAEVYERIATEAENRPTGWTVDMMKSEAQVRSLVIDPGGPAWENFRVELLKVLDDSNLVGYIAAYREVARIINL